MSCRTTMAAEADNNTMNDISIELNDDATNRQSDRMNLSASYLALVPRGLEIDVIGSLSSQFDESSKQHTSTTSITTTNMNMFVWNQDVYETQVGIAKSRMIEKDLKKRKRELGQQQQKQQHHQQPQPQPQPQNAQQQDVHRDNNLTSTTASEVVDVTKKKNKRKRNNNDDYNKKNDALASWTPSPSSPSSSSSSSFPVGHVRISPGHHCSIGYYPYSTEEGNIKATNDEVRYKSTVSTSGVLEGTAWIQIDTTTTTTTTDTSTTNAASKPHHVHTVLQKSRCVGPLLALVSTQTDNRCIASANKPDPTNNNYCRGNDKYSNHTVSDMVSEIRRHLVNESDVTNDTHDGSFRSRWETAFSVWKRWVLGDEENDDDDDKKDPTPNLWRDRLSYYDYQSLKDRINTNQLRFRLSCMRQDPPVYPPFLKQQQQHQHQQQQQQQEQRSEKHFAYGGNAMSDNNETASGNSGIRSEGHGVVDCISDGVIPHQSNDKVPGQQASRRYRLNKSTRRKGTSKEFNYERRDLVQGLMDDPICRQMLVPYYNGKEDSNDSSDHNVMRSSSPTSPTSAKEDVSNHDDHRVGGGWKVNLKKFDIELVMIIVPGSPGRWAFGISLLPYQFCKSKTFGHGVIPPDISSPYYGGVDSTRPNSSAVFDSSVIRLRPSTAQILLSVADLKPGDVVLDPFVGIGTIAVETDRFNSSNIGIGGDLALVDPSFSRSARDLGGNGFLAAWDSSCLPLRTASIDVVVSDLPFGQKCLSTNILNQLMPLVFWQCARALRPGGRMVLLCGSTPVSLVSFVEELSGMYWEKPFSRFSPVTIGGLVAWVIHVRRNHIIFDPCEEEEASYKARARKMVGRREQNNRRRHGEYTEQNARQKRKRPVTPLHSSVLVPTPGPTPGPSPAPTPGAAPAVGSKQKQRNSPNIVVMSEAGKPIFSRFPIKEKFGLLVQALRTSVNRNCSLELGEIQCLESNRKTITFMTVGSITLLSISDRRSIDGTGNAFVYAKYCLEYVYSQLIMTMTDQVQVMFQYNPSLDLQSSFSSNEKFLRGMLDDLDATDSTNDAATYMAAAVSPLFPFPHKLRNKVSKVLQSVCGRPENNVAFALLVAGDKMISMVQPPYLPHQLKASDLHLIIQVIAKQPGLTSTELWMPICLPRFNSSGFLYAYAKCVDDLSNLTVIILSSHGTTEQFQLLRESSLQLQKSLRIPLSADSVITALSPSSSVLKDGNNNKDDSAASASASASASSRTSSDMDWKRGDESTSFDETVDGDYVNISNDMVNVGKDLSTTPTMEDGELLYHTRQALNESVVEAACAGFLGDDRSSVIHFLFRLDVPIKDSSSHGQRISSNGEGRGCLSECITLPVTGTLDKEMEINRQRLWSNYQKINLRLRLGSSTVESSMDAFDMINKSCQSDGGARGGEGGAGTGQEENGVDDDTPFPSISKHCTAMGLIESPPCTVDGISYIIEGDEMYLGMNGKDFELFLVLSSNDVDVSIKRGAAIGAKLVRGIMSEEKKVFLSKPLTWRYY